MSGPALYDEDILLWSEEQAEIIRRLGRTRRDLPNELDIENVAEEIESVGRSELASVESLLQEILLHLIKIAREPQSDAARHWEAEVVAFHANVLRRFAESMRQRIDVDRLWRLARKQAVLASGSRDEFFLDLPERSPFRLDEFLAESFEADNGVRRLVASRKDGSHDEAGA
jgi:hypothetical protein